MSMFSMSGIANQERRSKAAMQLAFKNSKKRHSITHQDLRLTWPSSRFDMCSINYFSRLKWSKAFFREFQEHFELDEDHTYSNEPLFLVTLTDVSCTTAHDALFVDIHRYKRKLQAGLMGLNYVGMIEPGLYVNVAPGTRLSMKKAVSWHLHAVCWGESRKEMKKRFRRLNQKGRYLPIMHSQLGAHQKVIPNAYLPNKQDRTFLTDKLRYVLKSPTKGYRVYKTERVTCDGELVPCFRQKKEDLRKGDRIILFHLMKKLYLDELAVAGGEGTDIMRRIKRAAVQEGM